MKAGIDYPGVCVVFFCHDGNGNYLFQKRGKGARDQHGTWENGGGGIEHGETIEEALFREVREEYSCDCIAHEYIGVETYLSQEDEGMNHWITHLYLVKIERDKAQIGEPNKIDELAWFTLDNLPTPLHPGTAKDVEKYIKIRESQI